MEWNLCPIDLNAVVKKAANSTEGLFQERPVRLFLQLSPNLPQVMGDPERILQVLINLISNASKFTEQGSVTCITQVIERSIIISVKDSGVGIALEDQKKIFQRFKQAKHGLKDKPTGTGLGLNIAQEIIQHLGGKIWVESEPGQGSTFSFSLPILTETLQKSPN